MKKTIIILILVICIISLVYLVYVFSLPSTIPSIDLNNDDQIETSTTSQPVSDQEILEQALSSQEVEKCDSILDQGIKDKCYNELAIAMSDKNMCGFVKDPIIKTECINIVVNSEVVKTKNIELCELLEEEASLECVKKVVDLGIEYEQCDSIDLRYATLTQKIYNIEPRNLCKSMFILQEAVEKNDAAICSEIISNELRANCMVSISKIDVNSDVDADNLGYYYEIFYKSDPAKADTDGDGYKDGDEVKGGYDPAEAGGFLGYIPLKTFR